MNTYSKLHCLAVLVFCVSLPTLVFALDYITPSNGTVTFPSASIIDQSQPDTIRYDDTSAANSRYTGTNQWAAIRYTPIGTFQVRSVYLEFNNYQNRPDTITIFAVSDSVSGSLHIPKMSSILAQISGVRVPNPVFPATAVWLDTSFAAPFTRNQNQDFWIVYGLCPGGLTSGNGSWPLFDNSVDNLGRSLYVTGTAPPTNSSAWLAIFGYDWRCRVGGHYTNLHYVDLQSQYLYATSKKFQLATGFASQTFKAVIRNIGTDTVNSYSVVFTGRNGINQVIWTSTVSRGQIVPGATDTVQAGSSWSGFAADNYTIKDSISLSSDAVSANNISSLEQYVYDPAQAYEYRYDNSQINVNYAPGINSGVMIRFKPDNYPCEMDSVILMYSGSAPFITNLYVYTDSIGVTGPRILLHTHLNIHGSAVTNNRYVISVPSLTIISGSFYIGFICDSNFVVGLNNDAPLACQNLLMGTQRFSGTLSGSTLTWSNDVGPEMTIRASIKRTPNLAVTLTPSGTTTGYVGTDVWYPMIVQNIGQTSDSYNLSSTGNHWTTQIWNGGQTQQVSLIGPITPSSSQLINVKVSIPTNAINGAIDTAVIHATSHSNGSITSQASNYTHAVRLIDLQSQYLFASSKRFHLMTGFSGQTYKAVIRNVGNDTVNSYNVIFTAKNSSGSIVWTSTVNHSAIAPNSTDTIQAGSTFSGMSADSYTIQDSVSVSSDVGTTNNVSYLEQYVYDPTQPYEYRYDDGAISSNQNYSINTGVMVRYRPDSYPAVMDSVIFRYNGSASFVANLYVYSDSTGISAPYTLLYSQTQISGSGSRIAIHVPSLIINSGSYYVGLLCDSNLSVGMDNDIPLACQNTIMGTQRYSGILLGSTLIWTNDTGSDPLIHAYIHYANLSVAVGPSASSSGYVGTDVWYPMTVSNFSETSDTYNLSTTGNSWTIQIWNSSQTQQISNTGTIAPSFALPFYIKVSIPSSVANGIRDTAIVHAISQTNPSISSQAKVITKSVHDIDLLSQYVYATSKKFYLMSGFSGQTFRALIRNIGTDTVGSYSVIFTGKNSNNITVWSSVVSCGSIAPGAVDTVQASTLFTGMANDTYTISDSVSAIGDVGSANNYSALEQYVYNPNTPNEFRYDDGVNNSSLTYSVNTGIMTRYQPDYYPAILDSVVLLNASSTQFVANLYIYTDSIGATGPLQLLYSQNNITGSGNRVSVGVPSIPIYAGSYYIGFICDSNLIVGFNSNSPVACENTPMGSQRYSGTLTGLTPNWVVNIGFEPMLHAIIRRASLSASIGPSASSTGFLGTDVWYPMAVLNIGEANDSYSLSVTGNLWATQIWNFSRTQQISSTGLLTPFASQTINIRVSVPSNATSGTHDIPQIQAVSQANSTVSSTANTDTRALGYVADSGGPDGWGYSYLTNRALGGPIWAWEDTSFATRLPDQIGNDDDVNWQLVLPIGFSFKFYGQLIDTFWVGSNGFLLFSRNTPSSTFPNNPASMANAPNGYLGVFHTDLIYGDGGSNIWGGVYCKLAGTIPNRQFIISWIGMKQNGLQNSQQISFQTVLNENSNVIETRYQNGFFGNANYDYGVAASFGLKSWTGIDTLVYSVVSGSRAAVNAETVVDYIYPQPATINNLTATVSGNDVHLNWSPISNGVTNITVWADTTQPYSSGTAWYLLGSTSDTTFIDVNRLNISLQTFYRITAVDATDAIRNNHHPLKVIQRPDNSDQIRIVRVLGTPKQLNTN